MDIDNNDSAGKKPTRIQAENRRKVIDAALIVFSKNGYRGSTVEQIATISGMSKANVLYYFKRKNDIYLALLERTLDQWLEPMRELDPHGDPLEQLCNYTRQKLRMSREEPEASRLFANEILHGAPMIKPFLENELKALVDAKCAVIQQWIDDGKLVQIEPLHLILMVWSTTQHYADFLPQVEALHGGSKQSLFDGAEQTLMLILRNGLTPSPR